MPVNPEFDEQGHHRRYSLGCGNDDGLAFETPELSMHISREEPVTNDSHSSPTHDFVSANRKLSLFHLSGYTTMDSPPCPTRGGSLGNFLGDVIVDGIDYRTDDRSQQPAVDLDHEHRGVELAWLFASAWTQGHLGEDSGLVELFHVAFVKRADLQCLALAGLALEQLLSVLDAHLGDRLYADQGDFVFGEQFLAGLLADHFVNAQLQAYRETLGITGVFLDVNSGGQVPYAQVCHSLRLLADKVLPQFT
jgi:hypothetical protein